MNTKTMSPDYLFEVSWEVCNKVGGIHTVVSTKALTATKRFNDKYIVIGPDLSRENENSEFEEDIELLQSWRQHLYSEGIRVRVGRWKIEGNPIVVLIDFTSLIPKKDSILKSLWDNYRVDSIAGQWDYVEPVLFGHAAGIVVKSYAEHHCSASDRVVAHFHEWMTAAGGLFLQKSAPYIATAFTTHATVMGRCIAGNNMPLYQDLSNFNAMDLARQFNVVSKHSLERAAANNHDVFLTVSDITANECKYLLGKEVDAVTPNGFEDDFVWSKSKLSAKRKLARAKMISVAEAMLGVKFDSEPLIVGTSGRYEFTNKGIDVLLESLKQLASREDMDREILAYITVPAGVAGLRADLVAHLEDNSKGVDPSMFKHVTHLLENEQWDPVCNSIKGSVLESEASKVKVIFVPCYLNGNDGIFDMSYYELLTGMDMTVYPSYYEPWGYTPLESVAFGVPTITTTLAGFGIWVNKLPESMGVEVIRRDDFNSSEVAAKIAEDIIRFASLSKQEVAMVQKSAYEISRTALWENLFTYYEKSYTMAVEGSVRRANRATLDEGQTSKNQINFLRQQLFVDSPNWSRMMIEKSLPERLRALEELTANLWWCWNTEARELFEKVDPALWQECGRNPIELLDQLSLERTKELEQDKEFLVELDKVYAHFNEYMSEKPAAGAPKVAYFSMEYGLHSTLKIYSGGLGILAGDYLKEASDRNTPMVAMGLLYRYGYFTQRLSSQGRQEAEYEAQNFYKLPISPVRDEAGGWVTVGIALPGRTLSARVWLCKVGRTDLYLLDTDYEANLPEDRRITHHLYGGDWENRLKQEILLGTGGIRALRALGIEQEVYHCNEGHAAFIGLERIRSLSNTKKLSFSEAMEVVRSSSLFTTHTPVPAGHDAFPESMIRQYMSHYPDLVGITWEQFINLGKTKPNDPNEKFSMSVLACNLSQEVNGVSWLHGEVSKDILGSIWPGYFKDELHVSYVTNGVHFPTWVSSSLRRLYEKYFPEGFNGHTYNIPEWKKVNQIPDSELWGARMHLKEKLINHIKMRYRDPSQVRIDSPRQMVQVIESLKPEVLTIGFARRFATYKRAHLLFTNLERLSSIVNNKERPVQFVFAGKAHPNDKPGQDLIKRIVEVAAMPQFVGKILFIQNYDMELARRMVQGVDVWLNTPTRPLEASGTSGEKCVMNGVLQFSVLDGWWVEGYKPDGGWMLPLERTFSEQQYQDELDAEVIYNTIEDEIAPKYYSRDEDNIPTKWMETVKVCISDIASNFTTNRMLIDYEERFYHKLVERHAAMVAEDYSMARSVAAWKRNVSNQWNDVKVVDVQRVQLEKEAVFIGSHYHFEVKLDLGRLTSADIGVELVVAKQIVPGKPVTVVSNVELDLISSEGSAATYSVEYTPDHTGTFDMAIRVFPKSENIPHRMDFALVKWA